MGSYGWIVDQGNFTHRHVLYSPSLSLFRSAHTHTHNTQGVVALTGVTTGIMCSRIESNQVQLERVGSDVHKLVQCVCWLRAQEELPQSGVGDTTVLVPWSWWVWSLSLSSDSFFSWLYGKEITTTMLASTLHSYITASLHEQPSICFRRNRPIQHSRILTIHKNPIHSPSRTNRAHGDEKERKGDNMLQNSKITFVFSNHPFNVNRQTEREREGERERERFVTILFWLYNNEFWWWWGYGESSLRLVQSEHGTFERRNERRMIFGFRVKNMICVMCILFIYVCVFMLLAPWERGVKVEDFFFRFWNRMRYRKFERGRWLVWEKRVHQHVHIERGKRERTQFNVHHSKHKRSQTKHRMLLGGWGRSYLQRVPFKKTCHAISMNEVVEEVV